jgi:hypothetical protein
METEAGLRILVRRGKVHNLLEIWNSNEYLQNTEKKSQADTRQILSVGFSRDMEEMVK